MNQRPFNHTGRTVSEVGLGCWQLGGSDWGDRDDENAFAILHAAANGGFVSRCRTASLDIERG